MEIKRVKYMKKKKNNGAFADNEHTTTLTHLRQLLNVFRRLISTSNFYMLDNIQKG